MQAGAHRPYEDGDEIALLGAHPVDDLTGKQVGNGIEQREHTRDGTVVTIGPVEIGGNKVLPSE